MAGLTLLCMALLNPSIVYSVEPDKTLHNKCIYPTVKVEIAVERADGQLIGSRITGSGVIVRSKKIGETYCNVMLTCNHVVDTERMRGFFVTRLGG